MLNFYIEVLDFDIEETSIYSIYYFDVGGGKVPDVLQIHCANESSFAKTIQLFINPDACSIDMRLQNG